MVITVEELLEVDVFGEKGLAVRFLANDGEEWTIQLPHQEAHALLDMMAVGLSRIKG